MTGAAPLDWALLAVSLFNTVLLLWLGLTVFLNAERRVWGIWVATAGLLLGAVFFISHSAILGHGLIPITPGLNFWWWVGWIPVAALPFAWYLVMLWYTGFWDRGLLFGKEQEGLRRRQRLWFLFTLGLGLLLIGLLLFANPLPSFSQIAQQDLAAAPSVGKVPLMLLVYPVYTLLCIGLSLDALRRPEPSSRLMGDQARSRARRWLVAASLALLAVSLMVGWVMAWVAVNVHRGILSLDVAYTVGWFDLVIETLISLSILLLGQAVVSYEVFTGKTLPRRGLVQYWRSAILLAVGYSVLVAWTLVIQLRPIYSLLLSVFLMVVFYALLSWRSYAERELMMQNLRPFVASQKLYDAILVGGLDPPVEENDGHFKPFSALCANLLEARQAGLVPFGPLAPLFGPPLVFPTGTKITPISISVITSEKLNQRDIAIPLDPKLHAGMVFAVPLWSDRGLTGVLLLGEKRKGALYTQEEIEIARATGERLIDTRASGEIARRLVAIQRQRLVQNQVVDRRTRRVLHDEVLPLVHAAMLNLSANRDDLSKNAEEAVDSLAEIHRQLSDLLHALPAVSANRILQAGFLGALRKTVEEEWQGAFEEVTWQIQPEVERIVECIPPVVAEVLFFAAREAVRNAARHGHTGGKNSPLRLTIQVMSQGGLTVIVEDNGPGFDLGGLDTMGLTGAQGALTPGEGPIPQSPEGLDGKGAPGGGHGLALHGTMMAVVGGALSVESAPGEFTRVILSIPEATLKILADDEILPAHPDPIKPEG